MSLVLVAAACGSDDDTSSDETSAASVAPADDTEPADSAEPATTVASDSTEAPATTAAEAPATTEGGASLAGGELIDLGTFVGDPPEHIDPALNSTLDAYQVINAMYDGLTDIDASDPTSPVIKPLVAESYESNADATEWTFIIKDGQHFSDGEEILPSTFVRSWERASDPDFAGDYSYLFNFIDGGAEKLDGSAETISGVVADDASMTLTVTMDAPYSNFPAVSGFQLFFPMPEGSVDSPADYENGLMIGNGPYSLEAPRTDEEITLVRNEEWAGDINGESYPDRLEKIVFQTSADPDTAYNSFEAGEGDTANIPPARALEAQENWGTTIDVNIIGSYHYVFNSRSPLIGGDENKLLRQAISQAIDREDINLAVFNGTRTTSTGIVMEGIPGFKPDLCLYCAYDPDAAQAAFDEWVAAGNSQSEPLPIQLNADAGHEPVVQIIIDNLAQIGIEAVADPRPSETYFSDLADGACVFCRVGWYADYPTYDNFMYDLFSTDSLDGNNYGFTNEEFDALVSEAKQTTDPDAQAALFQQAEELLLNDEIMAVPLSWYRGDYVYNQEKITSFPQTNGGLILWEQITLAG